MEIIEIWNSYEKWLQTHVPEAYANLAPGASDSEIAAAEQVIGHPLPDDFKALLKIHNGQRVTALATSAELGAPALCETNLLSTKCIVSEWKEWDEMRQEEGDELASLQEIGATRAPGVIKPLYTSPHWIPLLGAIVRSDYFGADFEPDANGEAGQIINFGRDEERHYQAGATFTDLLRLIVDITMRTPPKGDPSTRVWWQGYPHAFEMVYYHHHPRR